MKLSLKALATNRINGSVTAFKTYPILDGGILGCVTDSGYWFINDDGEKQFAHKGAVRDGFSDPKKQYSFELVLQVDALQNAISENVKASITNACRPGGSIWMSSKFGNIGDSIADSFSVAGGFISGGFIKGASINKGEIMAQVWKPSDTPRPKEVERDAAVAELDKHLPGYRRSDKGFGLVESIEWLGKLNAAHEADCIKYERIIENLMEAFDIRTKEELKAFADNLARSSEIIQVVKNRK